MSASSKCSEYDEGKKFFTKLNDKEITDPLLKSLINDKEITDPL